MPPTSAAMIVTDRDDLPKVEQVTNSQPLSRPQTLQLLSSFLMEEQERRTTLREDNGLNSTWKDLQNAYDTLAMPGHYDEQGGVTGYDTFDGTGGGGHHNNNNTQDSTMMGGDGDSGDPGAEGWSKRLVLAASSRTSSFLGSPDAAALKDKKERKERKKKRKDAKKAAKKQAKLQAKMMIGNPRF